MYTTLTLHVENMFTTCTLHVHYMYTTCYLSISDIHIFHLTTVLVVFISHHIVPQSPGTCVLRLQLYHKQSVGVWSSCSHCIKSKDLTMHQTLRAVHHDEWCMHNQFHALHFPSGNGPLLSMLHCKGLL